MHIFPNLVTYKKIVKYVEKKVLKITLIEHSYDKMFIVMLFKLEHNICIMVNVIGRTKFRKHFGQFLSVTKELHSYIHN